MNLVAPVRAEAARTQNLEYMAMWAGQGYPLLSSLAQLNENNNNDNIRSNDNNSNDNNTTMKLESASDIMQNLIITTEQLMTGH